jgi:hypothetical protein
MHHKISSYPTRVPMIRPIAGSCGSPPGAAEVASGEKGRRILALRKGSAKVAPALKSDHAPCEFNFEVQVYPLAQNLTYAVSAAEFSWFKPSIGAQSRHRSVAIQLDHMISRLHNQSPARPVIQMNFT